MKKIRDFVELWAFIVLVAWILTGCATPERVVQVRVPVPVPCEVDEPPRPRLGIDSVPINAPIDVLIRNLRADHDVRDGYEAELRAALEACRRAGGQ